MTLRCLLNPWRFKIDELAANADRSRGRIVKQALAAIIEQDENRHQIIWQSLADVDAGRVVERLMY